jgi:hypothetical protein
MSKDKNTPKNSNFMLWVSIGFMMWLMWLMWWFVNR